MRPNNFLSSSNSIFGEIFSASFVGVSLKFSALNSRHLFGINSSLSAGKQDIHFSLDGSYRLTTVISAIISVVKRSKLATLLQKHPFNSLSIHFSRFISVATDWSVRFLLLRNLSVFYLFSINNNGEF